MINDPAISRPRARAALLGALLAGLGALPLLELAAFSGKPLLRLSSFVLLGLVMHTLRRRGAGVRGKVRYGAAVFLGVLAIGSGRLVVTVVFLAAAALMVAAAFLGRSPAART